MACLGRWVAFLSWRCSLDSAMRWEPTVVRLCVVRLCVERGWMHCPKVQVGPSLGANKIVDMVDTADDNARPTHPWLGGSCVRRCQHKHTESWAAC